MNKQEEILKFLKREKRCSTTKIAGYVSIPINYAIKYLEELEKENKVKKEAETNSNYWSLK